MNEQPRYNDYRDRVAYRQAIGQAPKYPPLRLIERRQEGEKHEGRGS